MQGTVSSFFAESDWSEKWYAFAFKAFSWRSYSEWLAVSEQAGVRSRVQGHFGRIHDCVVNMLSAGMMKTCDHLLWGQFLILSFRMMNNRENLFIFLYAFACQNSHLLYYYCSFARVVQILKSHSLWQWFNSCCFLVFCYIAVSHSCSWCVDSALTLLAVFNFLKFARREISSNDSFNHHIPNVFQYPRV